MNNPSRRSALQISAFCKQRQRDSIWSFCQ